MKSIKSPAQAIIAISVRLRLPNTLPDYYPAIESADIRQFIVSHLYDALPSTPILLDAKQFLNEIILIFDGSQKGSYRIVPQLRTIMASVIDACNKEAEEKRWSRRVSFVMAADAGVSSHSKLVNETGTLVLHTWSGLHIDRVSNLTDTMVKQTYPRILITHAFYKRLPEDVQKTFSTLYYILHICCYARGDWQ